jgi:hypothetical protein
VESWIEINMFTTENLHQNSNDETNFLTKFLSQNQMVVDKEKREITFSFTSSRPTERWLWDDELPEGASSIFDEILSHDTKAWNVERVQQDVCPFLKNHNRSTKLGQIKKVTFDGEKGYAIARLRSSPEADQLLSDIENEVGGGISFGYIPKEYRVITPAVYEEDRWGYKVLKTKAVLEATSIELLEISSEEIPADPTVGFNKTNAISKVYLKSITLNGDPNFQPQKKEKGTRNMELEQALQELALVSKKAETLTGELTKTSELAKTLQQQLSEKDQALSKAKADLQAYEHKQAVTSQYYSLRSKAELLNSEAKLPTPELKELFSDDASQDIETFLKSDENKLGYIAFHLGLVEKRSPLLNTEIVTKDEPLATSKANEVQLLDKAEDEEKAAERLLGVATSTRIYS